MISSTVGATMLWMTILSQSAVVVSWRRDWWLLTKVLQYCAVALSIAAAFNAIALIWGLVGTAIMTIVFLINVNVKTTDSRAIV